MSNYRSKIINLLYQQINYQFGNKATINRSPLRKQYSLHQYNIIIEFHKSVDIEKAKNVIFDALKTKFEKNNAIDTNIPKQEYVIFLRKKAHVIFNIQKYLDGSKSLSIMVC